MSHRFISHLGSHLCTHLSAALLALTATTTFAAAETQEKDANNGASVSMRASAKSQSSAQSRAGSHSKSVQSGKPTTESSSSQSSESSQSSSISDGDLTVKVTKRVKTWTDEEGVEQREEKNETSATLAGKPVSADRVRSSNGKVEILDEKGNVIRSVATPDLGADGAAWQVITGDDSSGRVRVFTNRNGQAGGSTRAGSTAKSGSGGSTHSRSITLGQDHPKVMLGVTMVSPDETMAQQLKVDPEQATVVASVSPDLPAAKAGIRQHDVIVSIDGQKPASPDRIRERLKGKEAGQTLSLGIVRGGEPLELNVTLDAWDAEKLGISDAEAFTFSLAPNGGSLQIDDSMREQIEQMMRQFEEQFSQNGDVDALIHQFFAPAPGGQGGSWRFFGPRGSATLQQGSAIAVPAPNAAQPTTPPSDTDDRIRQLEDRIEKLNETIRRLEELLNATAEKAAGGEKK